MATKNTRSFVPHPTGKKTKRSLNPKPKDQTPQTDKPKEGDQPDTAKIDSGDHSVDVFVPVADGAGWCW